MIFQLWLSTAPTHLTPSIHFLLIEGAIDPGGKQETLEDASRNLSRMENLLHTFFRGVAEKSITNIPEEKTRLNHERCKWHNAFSALVSDQSKVKTKEDVRRLDGLLINHKKVGVMLDSCQADGTYNYEPSTSTFAEIVKSCASLLTTDAFKVYITNLPKTPFAFVFGMIHPLYITAIYCSDCTIRKKAIDILVMSPWREGAWNSAAMGKIAQRKLDEAEERLIQRPDGLEALEGTSPIAWRSPSRQNIWIMKHASDNDVDGMAWGPANEIIEGRMPQVRGNSHAGDAAWLETLPEHPTPSASTKLPRPSQSPPTTTFRASFDSRRLPKPGEEWLCIL